MHAEEFIEKQLRQTLIQWGGGQILRQLMAQWRCA